MSTGNSPLDWAKFNLDSMTAQANATAVLLKAYSDYNFRMMEVLQKRVEIERDILKLRIMNDAFNDYRNARKAILREHRKATNKVTQIENNVRNTQRIAQGQELSPNLVGTAWLGLRYFLNNAPMETAITVNSVPVEQSHRAGTHFSYNRQPDVECESAPDEVNNVRSLLEFCASHNYMPKIATPPYHLFADIAVILAEQAETILSKLESKISDIQQELNELRTANWQVIDISFPPKEADDVEE